MPRRAGAGADQHLPRDQGRPWPSLGHHRRDWRQVPRLFGRHAAEEAADAAQGWHLRGRPMFTRYWSSPDLVFWRGHARESALVQGAPPPLRCCPRPSTCTGARSVAWVWASRCGREAGMRLARSPSIGTLSACDRRGELQRLASESWCGATPRDPLAPRARLPPDQLSGSGLHTIDSSIDKTSSDYFENNTTHEHREEWGRRRGAWQKISRTKV